MAHQETYRRIDQLINESEDLTNLGRIGINVASTDINPDHYVHRIAHYDPTIEVTSMREHLISKVHRYGVEDFSEMISKGDFGGPTLTKRAAKALAEKFYEYRE